MPVARVVACLLCPVALEGLLGKAAGCLGRDFFPPRLAAKIGGKRGKKENNPFFGFFGRQQKNQKVRQKIALPQHKLPHCPLEVLPTYF
jgi:hypothetical protein